MLLVLNTLQVQVGQQEGLMQKTQHVIQNIIEEAGQRAKNKIQQINKVSSMVSNYIFSKYGNIAKKLKQYKEDKMNDNTFWVSVLKRKFSVSYESLSDLVQEKNGSIQLISVQKTAFKTGMVMFIYLIVMAIWRYKYEQTHRVAEIQKDD